jgi:hypothetical protein
MSVSAGSFGSVILSDRLGESVDGKRLAMSTWQVLSLGVLLVVRLRLGSLLCSGLPASQYSWGTTVARRL